MSELSEIRNTDENITNAEPFEQEHTKSPHLIRALIIFFLASLFYAYEFALQVSPSVMTSELMSDLSLNAAGLGTMAAFYFYAYAPMQIPAGLLFDRFGPRIVMTIAIVVCSIGALFFAQANSIHLASIGRLLMGIGSACSFIGLLVLISRWFDAKYFALLAGLAQMMSSIGSIAGEVPLADSVADAGWRSTMFMCAVIGFILAALVWGIVRDYPRDYVCKDGSTEVKSSEFKKLFTVLKNPQTTFVGLYTFTLWAPVVVFAGMWGVPYTIEVYGLTASQAGAYMAFVWLGIGVGSPLFGWISDKIHHRRAPLMVSAALGILAALFVIYDPEMNLTCYALVMFILGLGASGQSLSFAVVNDNNTQANVGTASGINNFATVLGGALLQPLAGLILTLVWDGRIINAVPVYSEMAYRQALLILPVCFTIAFIVSATLIKETGCKKTLSAQPLAN